VFATADTSDVSGRRFDVPADIFDVSADIFDVSADIFDVLADTFDVPADTFDVSGRRCLRRRVLLMSRVEGVCDGGYF
jgi:hypothetical protein